jgi:DNA-binding LacI/PurR family transcriptional regulator
MPVTIKDIANELKLSASTVSRALRGGTEIKEETRRLVQEVATRLHYSPNPVALSLKRKRTGIIGVIVPEIANPFCSMATAGIEDIAYSRGYHVLILQSHDEYHREVISTQLLASRHIDGMIISVSSETTDYCHLENIMEEDIPMVMYDRVYDGIKTHKVVTDDYEGTFKAVTHLLEEGYRNIAHIGLSPSLSVTRNRLNGHRDALKNYGLELPEKWIIHNNKDVSLLESCISGLFAETEQPDALMIAAEQLVINCLRVCKKMELRIPEQVGIVCFSDNPVTEFIGHGLTAVRQPTFDIGRRSALMLIELIEEKKVRRQYKTARLNTVLDIQASSQRRKT